MRTAFIRAIKAAPNWAIGRSACMACSVDGPFCGDGSSGVVLRIAATDRALRVNRSSVVSVTCLVWTFLEFTAAMRLPVPLRLAIALTCGTPRGLRVMPMFMCLPKRKIAMIPMLSRADASSNKSVNADAQGRPAAARRLSLGAGYLQR